MKHVAILGGGRKTAAMMSILLAEGIDARPINSGSLTSRLTRAITPKFRAHWYAGLTKPKSSHAAQKRLSKQRKAIRARSPK